MYSVTQNIFELKDPQDYYCSVNGYRHNHSMMLIRVGKGEFNHDPDAFYITFMEVFYFEGAVSWKGATFNIAPKEEIMGLLIRLGFSEEDADILPNHYKLFIAEEMTTGLKAKILAARADITPDIPGGFHWLRGPVF